MVKMLSGRGHFFSPHTLCSVISSYLSPPFFKILPTPLKDARCMENGYTTLLQLTLNMIVTPTPPSRDTLKWISECLNINGSVWITIIDNVHYFVDKLCSGCVCVCLGQWKLRKWSLRHLITAMQPFVGDLQNYSTCSTWCWKIQPYGV